MILRSLWKMEGGRRGMMRRGEGEEVDEGDS